MGIFLFFLNREAQRALDITLSLDDVERIVRVLTVCSDLPLVTNYSNIVESGYLNNKSFLLNGLISKKQMKIAGERASYTEFIESRILRYEFDSDRYPMYFSSIPEIDVYPELYLTGSTKYIQDTIFKLNERSLNLDDYSRGGDNVSLNKLLPLVSKTVESLDEQAITLSIFGNALKSKKEDSGNIARLFSSIYIRHYLEELNLVAPTNVSKMHYFNHLSKNKFRYNIDILELLLIKTGVSSYFEFNKKRFDHEISFFRGDPTHQEFCKEISMILGTLELYSESNNCFDKIILKLKALPKEKIGKHYQFKDILNNIYKITSILKKETTYYSCYEQYKEINMQKEKTILIVTATNVETEALLKVCKEKYTSEKPVILKKNNYIARDLVSINGSRILTVQCEAGSGGASGSQAIVTEAIKDFQPNCIIMGGIAFGANKDEQSIGDILVSKSVSDYEKCKVGDSGNISRGEKIEASPKPLSVFRAASHTWSGAPIHFGTILTGEKLVNSKEFLDQLLCNEPEAIGGEMEGAGLKASACRDKVDWIIVKSIVDWGYDKESDHQLDAANEVFTFILSAIDNIGF